MKILSTLVLGLAFTMSSAMASSVVEMSSHGGREALIQVDQDATFKIKMSSVIEENSLKFYVNDSKVYVLKMDGELSYRKSDLKYIKSKLESEMAALQCEGNEYKTISGYTLIQGTLTSEGESNVSLNSLKTSCEAAQ